MKYTPEYNEEDSVEQVLATFNKCEIVSFINLYFYQQDLAKENAESSFFRIKPFFQKLIREILKKQPLGEQIKNFPQLDSQNWKSVIQNMNTTGKPDGPQYSDIATFFSGFYKCEHENWQKLREKCENFYIASLNQLEG